MSWLVSLRHMALVCGSALTWMKQMRPAVVSNMLWLPNPTR
ncbi:hypothetical protein [Pyrobaculum neutrophilum]|nr:hypothetical protein [Pyrobaculum neutrophilum]